MIETIRKVHFESPQRPIVFRVSPDLPGRVVMDVEAEWGALSVTVVLGRDGVLEIRDVCDRILQDWFCQSDAVFGECKTPGCTKLAAANGVFCGDCMSHIWSTSPAPPEPRRDKVIIPMICDVCYAYGKNAAPFHWISDVEQWECDKCWSRRDSQQTQPNDVPLNSELKDLPKEERPGMNCEICGNRAIPAYYVHAKWVCEKCNPANYKGSDDDIPCKVDYKRTPDYQV